MAGFEGDAQEPEIDLKIVVTLRAALDIAEATLYYEEIKESLAQRFDDALNVCFDTLLRHPRMFAEAQKSVRRGLLRGFPYSVYYQIAGETIYVIACLHTSRSAKHWKQRVQTDFRSNGKA